MYSLHKYLQLTVKQVMLYEPCKFSYSKDSNIFYRFTLYSIDTHFDTSTTDSFENIVGKGEIACNKQFLLFPQCFLLNQIIVSPFVQIFDIITLFAAELEEPKIGISGKGLTHYQTTKF